MGKQKIVISERDNIAVLFEDDTAVEFIIHRGDVLLGDVYLAQVENILPSIDAAFVNVGTERMGFLHSSDVQGKGDLKNRLQPKQNLVVQVMKEPTGHKGPRVTTNIAMPGRFLVLMPESRGISISRKIAEQKERSRLKSIVSLTKPPGVGIIIRTEAEGQAEAEIQEDFETLLERWQNIVAMADTAKPPTLLYRDQDLLYRVIREMVTEDVKEIVVDTAFGQQRANQLLQNWGVEHPVKVTLYNGPQSIMIGAGIDKEIKQALQTRVPLPSGGYLYIQPTEALTVIDVNSGKFTSLQSQAETIRLTNLEAAKEIARQLRLRNIGGMIIVDFIDMESRANQLSVLETFEMELSTDKAKPQIGQLSDLGLVEMTRHRQGQSLSEIFTRKCIACNGTGLNLEDFNWAPSSSEMARGVTGRTKMPIRSPQQQQRGGGGQQQGKPVAKVGGQTLHKFLNPRGQADGGGLPLREGFLQQHKQAVEKEEKLATETMSFDELYQHRLSRKFGIRLAHIAKMSYLPLAINSIMIRINAKANDIFTLVDAIEGATYMPSEMDGDFEDSPEGEGFEAPESEGLEAREGLPGEPDFRPGYAAREDFEDVPPEEGPVGEEEPAEAPAPRRAAAAVAVQERIPFNPDEMESLDEDEAEPASEEADAAISSDDEPQGAPVRRRRGRPAKMASAGARKSPDNEAEPGAPRKTRRGRPPKATPEGGDAT